MINKVICHVSTSSLTSALSQKYICNKEYVVANKNKIKKCMYDNPLLLYSEKADLQIQEGCRKINGLSAS